MQYGNIIRGKFLERENRFIAYVSLNGCREKVHVKNTGRCRELLVPGAVVYLTKSNNPKRSTVYDLVSVEKDGHIFNIDSQAPNQVVYEWLKQGGLSEQIGEALEIRPETKFQNSRFDFYVETEKEKIFLEVKGVTLEENGILRFPDAPSQRAVKHVEELISAKKSGYRVFVMFVIQMEGAELFMPNQELQPEFAEALARAKREGVEILAYDCQVTADTLNIKRSIQIKVGEDKTEKKEAKEKKVEKEETEGKAKEEKAKTEENKSKVENAEKDREEAKEQNETTERGKTGKQEKSSGVVKETLRFGSLEAIPKLLLPWYDTNRRILPWREVATPYRVWVSEIMLQQTRVETVKPYFERFMKALPGIQELAEAEEDVLLKLWEGLGYYNRVRNLQKAAVTVMTEYHGVMPDSYEELLKLSGIGSYTAGAIASIAYRIPVPAVDGNVLRVLARIRKDGRLISDAKVKSAVEQELLPAMPQDRPGDFNQAMMEIGACVCLPNGAPLCEKCPLASICMAHRDGTELEYPKKEGKKPRTVEEKTILVLQDANRTVIRKRPDRGLLAGMYEFPWLEGFPGADEVVDWLAENGIRTIRIEALEDARHIFTHREWLMKGYRIRVDELEEKNTSAACENWLYIRPEEVGESYPVPSAFGAYTKVLKIKRGKERYKEEES